MPTAIDREVFGLVVHARCVRRAGFSRNLVEVEVIMNAQEHHQRVSELFLAACELAPEQREAWLNQAIDGDSSLKAEIQSLLVRDTGPAAIDAPPALGLDMLAGLPQAVITSTIATNDLGALPARIGPFTIMAVLGRGGMGVVYLAHQDHPQRQVAIKVLRAGTASVPSLRRFETEAEALARLEHLGIARIYEAGTYATTEGDRPFFAMEFVRGMPITQYSEEHKLGVREKLELFEKVCEAVHYAHTKGVLHRDLKPGNILIDPNGQPKVLDFGVARVSASDININHQTEVWQIVGTLSYMSPEQASGKEVDTESDVFSLGVIAYELLAGQLPLNLSTLAIGEAVRVIQHEQPVRLSHFDRALRGDIETIVAKAMEKDKDRRYASADMLASDIRRFLKNEPISARPASQLYRLRKFSRRNRALVSLTAATLLTLSVGLVERTRQARIATARADAEVLARKRTDRMFELVKALLNASDPEQGGDQDKTIRQAMEPALAQIEAGSLKDDPETEADLSSIIASVLMNNGEMEKAERLYAKSLSIYRQLFPRGHLKVATGANDLAALLCKRGDAVAAEPLFEDALQMYRGVHQGDHADVAAALNNLAYVFQYTGRAAEAKPRFEDVLAMNRRLYPGDHEQVATSLNNLGSVYEVLHMYLEAETLYIQALEMTERLVKGDHPDLARGFTNLAMVRHSVGRHAEAEPLFIRALEIYERLYRGNHPSVANGLNNVGSVLNSLGRASEAEPYYTRALDMSKRIFQGDHAQVANCMGNLAHLYVDLNQPSEAEALQMEALQMFQRLHTRDDPDVANSLNGLALIREALNRPAEAEPLFVQSLEMYQRLYPGDDADVAIQLGNLARAKQSLGKAAEARVLFDEAIAMFRRLSPQQAAFLANVLWQSGSARMNAGEDMAAMPELTEAVTVAEASLSAEHPDIKKYRDTLEKCRAGLGR